MTQEQASELVDDLIQSGDADLAHPERLKALSDAADYVEKIGARYHSGRDIANGIRCLGPRSPTVAQAPLMAELTEWFDELDFDRSDVSTRLAEFGELQRIVARHSGPSVPSANLLTPSESK